MRKSTPVIVYHISYDDGEEVPPPPPPPPTSPSPAPVFAHPIYSAFI